MSGEYLTIEEIAASVQKMGSFPDQVRYQYYKNLLNRRLLINDSIDSTLLETVTLPLLEMDSDGSGQPIEILLNTNGGSIYDGLSLCNVIDGLKTPTTITVITYAFSMGGLILMAGFNNPQVRKRCYPYSVGLIHAGNVNLGGNSNSVKDFFDFHTQMEKKIKNYVLTHSRIGEKLYHDMERFEFYMTAEDLLKYGLVDEIIG